MYDSLQPHRLQHTRLLCPLVFPGVWPSSCPLSLWCLPSISSSAMLFSFCLQSFPASGSFPIKWPKYWSFSISPSNEYSELISFRIDWFDLFVVQGTLKSLLQHHSSKASVLWFSALFTDLVTSSLCENESLFGKSRVWPLVCGGGDLWTFLSG